MVRCMDTYLFNILDTLGIRVVPIRILMAHMSIYNVLSDYQKVIPEFNL